MYRLIFVYPIFLEVCNFLDDGFIPVVLEVRVIDGFGIAFRIWHLVCADMLQFFDKVCLFGMMGLLEFFCSKCLVLSECFPVLVFVVTLCVYSVESNLYDG